jgi:hypothetical protein
MRVGAAVVSGVLALAALLGAPSAQGANVDGVDVQTLPRHMQQIPYPHELQGASPGYVMHNVHDLPWYDGHSHLTVLRTADGSAAWSDFDASPDASNVSLEGRYVVEKVGNSTYWPDSLRFFDVETHALAGTIALPGRETLAAVGPGWILSTDPSGSAGPLSSYLVVHRLDGTSDELTDVPVNTMPVYAGTEGTSAWLRDGYGGPLFQVDVASGDVSVVPRPVGMEWSGIVVGPSRIFNLDDQYNGHVKVTAIDRSTGDARTYDVLEELGGNAPRFLSLGDGLAAYHPWDQQGGTLFDVDLEAGSLGAVVEHHVSDAHSMGPGSIAMTFDAQAPGTIAVDSGTGLVPVADFPRVSEGATRISYDGDVRVTWGDDTTWSTDPDNGSAGWTDTAWTTHQNVTTSGGTTLVNDLDDSDFATSHWHLLWPGGQRDLEGQDMVLGHGGELLVRRASSDASRFEVERVRTGEVVATASDTGVVADRSWVWTTSSAGVLTGVDVDQPGQAATIVPVTTNGVGAAPVDVRGRWALVAVDGTVRVVDIRGVVPQWTPPTGYNSPGPTMLGDGFVVSSTFTYDVYHHVDGYRTIVSDLGFAHESRDLVDPVSGKSSTTYAVDEAGSHSLAYIDRGGLPKIAHLPWLHDTPLTLPDTAPPALVAASAPAALTRSTTAVQVHFSWTYSDEETPASPASGVLSYDVRYRTRKAQAAFGAWTTTSSVTQASLTRTVQPGYEVCAQSRSTDVAGNTTAWSQERCARVDGSAPVLAPATGSPRFTVPDYYGNVRYAYQATDDHAVRLLRRAGPLGRQRLRPRPLVGPA